MAAAMRQTDKDWITFASARSERLEIALARNLFCPLQHAIADGRIVTSLSLEAFNEARAGPPQGYCFRKWPWARAPRQIDKSVHRSVGARSSDRVGQ
jgi:hypothetical protein